MRAKVQEDSEILNDSPEDTPSGEILMLSLLIHWGIDLAEKHDLAETAHELRRALLGLRIAVPGVTFPASSQLGPQKPN